MNIPAHLQDLNYHLGELTDKLKLHEEWLQSLQVGLPCDELRGLTELVIRNADEQARLTESTTRRFAELFPQPPQGVDPEAWKELMARVQDQSHTSRDLFYAARRLYEYVRENCDKKQ